MYSTSPDSDKWLLAPLPFSPPLLMRPVDAMQYLQMVGSEDRQALSGYWE